MHMKWGIQANVNIAGIQSDRECSHKMELSDRNVQTTNQIKMTKLRVNVTAFYVSYSYRTVYTYDGEKTTRSERWQKISIQF